MGNRISLEKRFWAKVRKTDTCWLWTGATYLNGYGVTGYWKDNIRYQTGAHRVSYMIAHGKMPELHVLHRCDVRNCVRPDHLFLGTQGENMRDKLDKGRDHNQRKTHCKHGHPFSGDNLIIHPKRKTRMCRICRNHSSKIAKRKIRNRLKRESNSFTTKA